MVLPQVPYYEQIRHVLFQRLSQMLHSLNESLQFQLVIGPDYEMNFIQTTHCSSHKTELAAYSRSNSSSILLI
ncbi:hypothetical protein QL285_053772 [Trifolium repens]|nr:hypothetical protein QL285_053772 [Trifolium repens]